VRLVDTDKVQSWNSRGHFFAAAAEAMRRILVEQARRKGRLKHGREHPRVDLDSRRTVLDFRQVLALRGIGRRCLTGAKKRDGMAFQL
jgi:hypothetical protein